MNKDLNINWVPPEIRNGINFDKIKYIENLSELGLQRVRIHFQNKYSLSIVQGEMTYGGNKGLFEVAPFDKNNTMNGAILNIPGDNVIGNLSVQQVQKIILKIGELR